VPFFACELRAQARSYKLRATSDDVILSGDAAKAASESKDPATDCEKSNPEILFRRIIDRLKNVGRSSKLVARSSQLEARSSKLTRYSRLISDATYPAPNPLSMFTTLTFDAQEFIMPSKAARPLNEAP
jgi:hypothetical protein